MMREHFIRIGIIIIWIITFHQLNAQKKYHDASDFLLIGKISNNTETMYERLPKTYKEITRNEIWLLGKHTAGLAVIFNTNSTSISIKWELLNDAIMDHMPFTGIKGVDLYAWEKEKWQFVNVGRPYEKMNDVEIINNMSKKDREYLLYLPLYDGIKNLEIGIDKDAAISAPINSHLSMNGPIIAYGTSITQGGCASRPGMAYTNILSRRLNKEVINLGFSGNGRLDYEIAELISERTDASLIILDFLPNVSPKQILEKTEQFISIIRTNGLDTPILLIENVKFPSSVLDLIHDDNIKEKNRNLRSVYISLIKKGEKNIHYLSASNLIGDDGEATVDGIHFTDLGFFRFAEAVYPIVRDIIW